MGLKVAARLPVVMIGLKCAVRRRVALHCFVGVCRADAGWCDVQMVVVAVAPGADSEASEGPVVVGPVAASRSQAVVVAVVV